jgi:FAD/FMN-containing dehydrogenase
MTTNGDLSSAVVQALEAGLRGKLTRPGDRKYNSVRAVHNALIDRRPAAIVRCVDVADVLTCVRVARAHDLLVAVRSGGHNAAGLGIADEALVIDLGGMRGLRVDSAARTVTVDGGCTWGDVDHATHAFGLAAPSGIISTTGVGGLTLGGGIGHLTRHHGLTIDNLVSADVVLADGSFVTASADTHRDLYWALRGGGGNFGIVTSFTFRCHPVSTVIAGPIFYDLASSADVLSWYRDFLPEAPKELNGCFLFGTVPPAPPFPDELHGRAICGVVWVYTGDHADADEVLAPVRSFGSPLLDGIHEVPFPVLQSVFDSLYPPGLQLYWRTDFFREITDDALAVHEKFAEVPTPLSTMHLYPVDAAAHQVGPEDTAFSHRDATWASVILGADPDPAKADMIRDWSVRYWDELHPTSVGSGYVNFMMTEGQDRVEATYGGNFDRLARIKAVYDPDNFFRVNQNIPPAA